MTSGVRGRWLVGILAGGSVALSLPPMGWWPLGIVGFFLLASILEAMSRRDRFVATSLFALSWLVPTLLWALDFNWYGAIVLMLVESFIISAPTLLVARRRGEHLALIGALVLAMWLRASWPFGGLPIGDPSLGQSGGPLLSLARLGGPLLIDLVVVGAGFALARALSAQSARVGALLSLVGALGLVLGADLVPDGGAPLRGLSVALVQSGGPRGDRPTAPLRTPVFASQVATATHLSFPASTRLDRLIVLPEDALSLESPLRGSWAAQYLGDLAASHRSTLVVGYTRVLSKDRFANKVAGFSSSGALIGTVSKVHRVPFGEYVPYRSFVSKLASLRAVPYDEIPASNTGLLSTPRAALGILISYEVFYPSRAASSVRAGARLLIVSTNTASYATSQVPSEELAADRLQAAAFGRDVVQVAETGYSDAVAPDGRILVLSVLGAREILYGDVALRSGETPYALFGDWPVLIVCGLMVGVSAFSERRYS